MCKRQLHFSIECIFVDGGSGDGSVTLCEKEGFVVLHAPTGRGRQLDEGARNSHGKVLLFLHADSHPNPEHCKLAVESVVNNGVMLGGFRLQFDDKHPILKMATWINLIRFRLTRVLYGDHGIFMGRDKYETVGGFPKQALFEDVVLSKKARRLGPVVILSYPLKTSSRRFRAGGVIRTYLHMAVLHILFWCKVSPERLARLYGKSAPSRAATINAADKTRVSLRKNVQK